MNTESVVLDGKRVGDIYDDAVYVSFRRVDKSGKREGHLFRGGEKSASYAIAKKTAAWGINDSLLRHLKSRGIEVIAIWTTDRNTIQWLSRERVEKSTYVLDMGHGLQRFIHYHEWNVIDDIGTLVEHTKEIMGMKRRKVA